MMKVSVRGGFSDRNGISPENTDIQLKEFDKRTRTQLQNMLNSLFVLVYDHHVDSVFDHIQDFIVFVVGTVYSCPIDHRKTYSIDDTLNQINYSIQNGNYDEVLTLIESIIRYWDSYMVDAQRYVYFNEYINKYGEIRIYDVVNEVFQKEYIGYRFVDGYISQISDEHEIMAIQDALSISNESVYEHISKAHRLLANRENPDYENSIKESISAVEALCVIITGAKGKDASLSSMLNKLEDKGIVINKSMKSAFNALYGYTSGANGIRHAGDLDGPASTFEEAKYMLVVCCAFVNYLVALYSKGD